MSTVLLWLIFPHKHVRISYRFKSSKHRVLIFIPAHSWPYADSQTYLQLITDVLKQGDQTLRWLTIQWQIRRRRKKDVKYLSYIHRSCTEHVVHDLFKVHKNHKAFRSDKNNNNKKTISNLYFWHTCGLETRLSMLESIDPKQGDNQAMFESSFEQCPRKKPMLKIVSNWKTCTWYIIYLEYVQKQQMMVYLHC